MHIPSFKVRYEHKMQQRHVREQRIKIENSKINSMSEDQKHKRSDDKELGSKRERKARRMSRRQGASTINYPFINVYVFVMSPLSHQ